MTDDDWAPLPADDLCARPGEAVEVHRREAPPPPAPAPGAPAENPEAERVLAALKARIARSAPARSLIAEVQHREQRAQRRRQAATVPQLAATVVAGRDPAAVPVVEYAAGPEGRDEREESEWFRGLPAAEQERLRAAWADKRAHATGAVAGQVRVGRRRFVAALVVFVANIVAGTGIYWHATLGAGIVCGLWWRRAPADRFLDPLRAIGCLYVMQALAMLVNREVNPTLFMDSVLLVALAAIVGFDGEIRRTGGFDVR